MIYIRNMEELEGYINFWQQYIPDIKIKEEDLCVIYSKSKKEILLKKTKDQIVFPAYKECKELIKDQDALWYLGKWVGTSCFAYELEQGEPSPREAAAQEGEPSPLGSLLEWVDFRDGRWAVNRELYYIGVKAQHLLNWDRSSKYCGFCGAKNERLKEDRGKKCPKCGAIVFPRISPAVIVGIKKDDKLLMAHNSGFREGLYSIIAGFVEQGETLEMAVRREVFEEVGIRIKNIKYHHSRPWNSIDSLMMGFTAEYESGEIKVDGREIVDAGWYDKDHLPPQLPDRISTARTIIDDLLELE